MEDLHRQIGDMTGVSWIFYLQILIEELRTKSLPTKFVPYLFTEDQNQSWLNACKLKEQLEVDPVLFMKTLMETKAL